MATIPRKQGDTLFPLLYTVKVAGTPFDFSDVRYRVLASSRRDDTLASQYDRRDIDAFSRAGADPTAGEVNVPIWDGRTAYGATSAAVNVVNNAVNGKISVELAKAAGVDTLTQEIFMSKAGEHVTGPWYLVASGANGFADSGMGGAVQIISIADATLALGQLAHADGQDVTLGGVALPVPVAPAPVALAGVGAGLVANGNHSFVGVNRRGVDTENVGLFRVEVIIHDSILGADATWPPSGFEYLQVTEDI